MQLFNRRIIERNLSQIATRDDERFQIARQWAKSIRSQAVHQQKETNLHGDFKARIVEALLGYRSALSENSQTVAAEHRMGTGSVDLALGHFDTSPPRVIAPFELKGADTRDLDAPMPGRNKTPVEQAWEYATAVPGVRWVLVSNYLEIRLYSYGEGRGSFERFDLSKIDQVEHYAKLQLLLSAESLLGGRTEDLLRQSREADREVSEKLYADYRQLREALIAIVRKLDPTGDPVEAVGIGQKILDRVLFIAFAEDTGLLPPRTLHQAFTHRDPYHPRPVWETFKGLFKAIDQGNDSLGIPRYNGGLFETDPRIDVLDLPDPVCEGFKALGDYDFATEIGVTILGHIFEQSIADMERLLARARGEIDEQPKKSGARGRRKRDGIVYTPDYIARFIVERTLGTHLDEMFRRIMAKHATGDIGDYDSLKFARNSARGQPAWNQRELAAWTAYRFRLQTLRVVDPACGSGVFLVTAFDFLKAEYDRVNKKMEELRGAPDLFDPDSEILSQNLYGVDVNAESVEITKLSLWLKTARRGKVLDSLDHTIRVGDSLIEDSNFAYLEHGFNWRTAFPEVFAAGGFDVVLGNPPYVRQELISGMKPYLQRRFEVYNGVADLYTYFFERGVRLLKSGGRLGFISSSTFFKTASGGPLRRYLVANTALETVTDFGDLQIFQGVTTYPAILTLRRETGATDNWLKFWNLDKLPNDNFSVRFDDKAEPYPQSALTEKSWELESPALRRLRDKITAGKPTLKEVYGSPYRGVLTGLNEAFVIDRATRDRLIAEDPKSEEILKPWLEGKDLKRWRAEPRDIFVIFARRGLDIERYPAVKKHLAPYRERLEPRPSNWPRDKRWPGRKPGAYKWYELQDTVDYWKIFENPKIVYNDISSSPSFVNETNLSYTSNTTYLVNSDFFLLCILNSNIFWFFYLAASPTIRGGFLRMFSQYIDTVPIPPATDADKATLAALAEACQTAAEERYKRQQAVRRRIGDLCPPGNDKVKRDADGRPKLSNKLKDWWELADFAEFRAEVKRLFKADIPLGERSDWEDWLAREKAEIIRLSGEIAGNEAEINRIVYRLFALTDEEIALLEANI
jgi:hypothetical protein